MMARQVQTNPGWCKGCGICVEFCPGRALGLVRGRIRMLFPDQCIQCGICELRCPDYAIWLEDPADDLTRCDETRELKFVPECEA